MLTQDKIYKSYLLINTEYSLIQLIPNQVDHKYGIPININIDKFLQIVYPFVDLYKKTL